MATGPRGRRRGLKSESAKSRGLAATAGRLNGCVISYVVNFLKRYLLAAVTVTRVLISHGTRLRSYHPSKGGVSSQISFSKGTTDTLSFILSGELGSSMRVIDTTKHASTGANLLLSWNGLSCVKSDGKMPCLCSGSSRFHRFRDYDSSSISRVNKIKDIDYLDMNDYSDLDSRRKMNANKSSAFAKSQNALCSVSGSTMYSQYFDGETLIQDSDVYEVCVYLLPLKALSQDDCLNSKNYPKLFASRFQQSWCIRRVKFQVGLINSREASGPMVYA